MCGSGDVHSRGAGIAQARLSLPEARRERARRNPERAAQAAFARGRERHSLFAGWRTGQSRRAYRRRGSFAALGRLVSSEPGIDLANLLDGAIFNYLVGNNDTHGKNFSLVYPDKEIRLAPLYDAISTIYYPELNADMAMRIGHEYSSDKVTPKDFEQPAGDARLAKPSSR